MDPVNAVGVPVFLSDYSKGYFCCVLGRDVEFVCVVSSSVSIFFLFYRTYHLQVFYTTVYKRELFLLFCCFTSTFKSYGHVGMVSLTTLFLDGLRRPKRFIPMQY